jgi:hypothetical protein
LAKPVQGSYFLNLETVTDNELEQFQAQALELWLRYRLDERRMLNGFFRTALEVAGDRRHGRITAAVVRSRRYSTARSALPVSSATTNMANSLAG